MSLIKSLTIRIREGLVAPIYNHCRLYLSTVLVTFFALIGLGTYLAQDNHLEIYPRFPYSMQQETDYYLTLDQWKNYILAQYKKNTTLVLCGGSSIFWGIGCQADHTMAAYLKVLLGGKYTVINLAMRGGMVSSNASVLYESLKKSQAIDRVIYVCPIWRGLGWSNLDGHEHSRYLFWEAMVRGQLFPYPERSETLSSRLSHDGSLSEREIKHEIVCHAYVEEVTHACELWNWISYNYFSSVWSGGASYNSFAARKSFSMDDSAEDPPLCKAASPNIQRSLSDFEDDGSDLVPLRAGQLVANENNWIGRVREANLVFPKLIRSNMIMVLPNANPFLLKMCPPLIQQRTKLIYNRTIIEYQKMGFQTYLIGQDFTDDDFRDEIHIRPSGQLKMAKSVAEIIQKSGFSP